MQQMGTWPISATNKEYYLKVTLFFIWQSLTIITLTGEINFTRQYFNIVIFLECVCVCTTAFLLIFKNTTIFFKRKEMEQLILMLNDLYVHTPIEESVKIRNITKNIKEFITRFGKILFFMSALLGLQYNILPWMVYFKTGKKVFQFPTKLPIDTDNWAQYMLIYIIESFVSYITMCTVSADALFAALISLICTRMDILVESMDQFIRRAASSDVSKKLFRECIQYQEKIYRYKTRSIF